jgi:hypothetical protein
VSAIKLPLPVTGEGLDAAAAHRALFHRALIGAFAVGAAVRVYHTFRVTSPLNDGGLFYTMVQDLQAAHYRLPDVTSYNHIGIPFAYPPLGLYIAAVVDDLTPFDLATVFRVLPLLYCLLTLGAVYLLARRFSSTPVALVITVAAFGLIPRSFIWLIMGGGVTRSLGLLLAVLALWRVHLLYSTGERRYLWTAALFAGATVLAHLETGAFLALSIAVFWMFLGRDRRGLANSLLLAGATAAIASPWALMVVARHGMDPFLGAFGSGSTVLSGGGTTEFVLIALGRMIATSEGFFPLLGVLGVAGAVIAITRGQYLLPAWWAAIILFDARAFHTFSSIPIAILAGQAVDAVLPALTSVSERARSASGFVEMGGATITNGHAGNGYHSTDGHSMLEAAPRGGIRGYVERSGMTVPVFVMGTAALTLSVISATRTSPGFSEVGILTALGGGQRTAMQWIEQYTPADATFLVMPRGGWQTDKEAEWFPVFTHRTSVATVQGWEWMPQGEFEKQVRAFDAAWDCGYKTASCLDRWMQDYHKSFDYVYIPADAGIGCCSTLISSLATESNYRLLYYGVGGSIYARGPT